MSNDAPQTPATTPASRPLIKRRASNRTCSIGCRSSTEYRWAALVVFAMVVGWVMVDSYTRIPVFRSTARILIEDPNNDIATPTEISRNVNLGDPEIYMQTQLRIMRGRDLAQRVAAKLHMENVPEFNGQGPKPTQLAVGIALVKYYALWPYRLITSTQADTPAPTTVLDPLTSSAYPDALLARLSVSQVRGSQLVDMTFSAADPEFAARAANMLADEYVGNNLALKVATLEKSAEWLTGEVEKQGKLVQQSELALAEYKENAGCGRARQQPEHRRRPVNGVERVGHEGADRSHHEGRPVPPDRGRRPGHRGHQLGHRQSTDPDVAQQPQPAGTGTRAAGRTLPREPPRLPEGRGEPCHHPRPARDRDPEGAAERQGRVRAGAAPGEGAAVSSSTRPRSRPRRWAARASTTRCCCARRNRIARSTTSC